MNFPGKRVLFAVSITLLSLHSAASGWGEGIATQTDTAKPNVIVIVADDLGIVDVNAYAEKFTGAKPEEMYYETPNIDRLVREGTSFSQGYACHLCSPTRASLLTGKYAARLGFTTAVGGNVRTFYNQGIDPPAGYVAQDAIEWKDKIDIQQALLNGTTRDALASGHSLDRGQDETTLAEAMSDHHSAFIGKWHVGGHGSKGWQPSDQGFEEVSYFDEGGSPYFHWRPLWNRRGLVHPNMPQVELRQGKSGANLGQDYLTDELTEQAINTIKQHAEKEGEAARPLFLYLCHFAVHTPFQAPAEEIAHFEQKTTRGWNGHSNAIYAAMLKRLDVSVGRILDTLDQTGLDENTIVVFISDNGGVTYTSPAATNNAPFKGGKALHFEGGIRVPIVYRWKGHIDSGQWCDVPVDCNDLFPTLLQLTGYDTEPYLSALDQEHSIDGRSIKPLFTDVQNTNDGYPRDTFYWHYPLNVIVVNPEDGYPAAPSSAIRQGDWKLIFDWSGAVRLYNIDKDPYEKDELSKTMPDKAESLFRQLNDWIDAHVDVKYTPALNPNYVPPREARERAFVDLRQQILGESRAVRTAGSDPRLRLLNQAINKPSNQQD